MSLSPLIALSLSLYAPAALVFEIVCAFATHVPDLAAHVPDSYLSYRGMQSLEWGHRLHARRPEKNETQTAARKKIFLQVLECSSFFWCGAGGACVHLDT